jgi:hypothetical protein
MKPFLDCYIFEVKQWPKYGPKLEYYALADVYHYNSLTDDREDKKQSPFIQIPEKFVRNANIQFILDNLKDIVENNKPIIKRINDDLWEIDYEFAK